MGRLVHKVARHFGVLPSQLLNGSLHDLQYDLAMGALATREAIDDLNDAQRELKDQGVVAYATYVGTRAGT